MTEVQDSTIGDEWWGLRYIALVLAMVWAGAWTGQVAFLALIGFAMHDSSNQPTPLVLTAFLVQVCFIGLIPWLPVVIAWRREAAGGIALLLAGLASFFWVPLQLDSPPYMYVPPLVAGSLFLARWWRSRASGTPQNSA